MKKKARVQAPPATGADEPLLTLALTAKRLRVSQHLVRRMTIRDGLRWTRIGRELRFKREWVEDFINRELR
jgi:excisionase family DNA binding protein